MEFKCQLTGVFVSKAKGNIVLRFIKTSLWMGYGAVIPSAAYWNHENLIRLDKEAMKALKILRDHRAFHEYLDRKAQIEKTAALIIQDREYRNLCKIAGGTYYTAEEFHEEFLNPIAIETERLIKEADERVTAPKKTYNVEHATFDRMRQMEDFFELRNGYTPEHLVAFEERVSHPDERVDESGMKPRDRVMK